MIRLKYAEISNYKYFTALNQKVLKVNMDENCYLWISGPNGYGKSSLVEILRTPFPKDFGGYGIVDGEEGYKYMVYTDGDKEYHIRHNFSPTKTSHNCKSTFDVVHPDGRREELNPTGKVTKVYEIIESVFGITKDNDSILKLSVADQGLVTMKPAIRRDYLKGIISQLKTMEDLLKNVDVKFTINNKELKATETKINGYKDKDTIDKMIREARVSINLQEKALKDLYLEANTRSEEELDSEIAEYESELDICDSRLECVQSYLEAITEIKIGDTMREIETLHVDQYKSLSKLIPDMTRDILNKSSQIEELKMEIQDLKEQNKNSDYYNSIKHSVDNTSKDVIALYEERKNDVIDLDEINRMRIELPILLSSIKEGGSYILNMIINGDEALSEYESDLDIYARQLEGVNDEISFISDKIKEIGVTSSSIFDNIGPPNISCKLDCGYRSQYADIMSKIAVFNDNSSKLDKLIENRDVLIKDIAEIKNDIDIFRRVKSFCDKYSCTLSTIHKYYIRGLHELDVSIFNVKLVQKYKDELAILKGLNQSIATGVSSQITKLEMEIQTLNQTIVDLERDLESRKRDLAISEKKVKVINETLNDCKYREYDLYNKDGLFKESSSISKRKQTLKDKLEKVIKEKSNMTNIKDMEAKIKDVLDLSRNNLIEYEKEYHMINTLSNEYTQLSSAMKYINAVRDALKIHIPVIVMNSFLDGVQIYVNNFFTKLNLPYRLNKFVVSDDEFKIQVIVRGSTIDDVSLCSSAEKALFSLAINLSIIRSLPDFKKYNLFVLDEVDATMDEDNRQRFIDLLITHNKDIDLDQILIISHNKKILSSGLSMSYLSLTENGLSPGTLTP